MMMLEATPERAGAAGAVVAAIREASMTETLSGLIAARNLARLRDERLYVALGARSLPALIEARLPSLDKATARRLLQIADAIAPGSEGEVARLPLARLATIATAPAAAREQLLAEAEHLPAGDLRRRVREASVGTPTATDAFVARIAAPVAPPDVDLAAAVVVEVERAWNDLGIASWSVARGLARLRDEELWVAIGGPDYENAVESILGFSPLEQRRALGLVDQLSILSLPARTRIGITAAKAIASVADEDLRRELVAASEQPGARAEHILSGVRSAAVPSIAPTAPNSDAVDAEWVDDPLRLAPFSMIYVPDAEHAPTFEEATPAVLVEQLLRRTTVPGDAVLDLTAGSGTVARVAARLGRRATSIDILNPPLAADIESGDARGATPAGAPFAAVFIHPPALGEINYSDRYASRELAGDLSHLTPEGFQTAMEEILVNARRQVRSDGSLALVCREARAGGKLIDWPARLSLLAERHGWSLRDRLYAPLPPIARRELEQRHGYRARAERRAIPVVLNAFVFAAVDLKRREGRSR